MSHLHRDQRLLIIQAELDAGLSPASSEGTEKEESQDAEDHDVLGHLRSWGSVPAHEEVSRGSRCMSDG